MFWYPDSLAQRIEAILGVIEPRRAGTRALPNLKNDSLTLGVTTRCDDVRAPPPDSVNQAGCQCEEPVLLTYVARRLYVFRPGYAIQYACGRGMAMRTRYARACMGGMWAAGRGRRRVHMRYTALQTAR